MIYIYSILKYARRDNKQNLRNIKNWWIYNNATLNKRRKKTSVSYRYLYGVPAFLVCSLMQLWDTILKKTLLSSLLADRIRVLWIFTSPRSNILSSSLANCIGTPKLGVRPENWMWLKDRVTDTDWSRRRKLGLHCRER